MSREVLLSKGKAGQPLDSIIMAHQIRTISKQRLGRLLGYLDDVHTRNEVLAAIKEHLDIE
ncbi:MAG: type II toxin-antitoxin system PemK/MazF family toxin [Candidatus Tectomicrobia bacterium]|uniref:Type II toxin-antitoxin system PemK/MazF family toxin n=1 Tax=Tectimicrobiota bacterium TaxID=2528274 RepID=A0A933LRA2_UNCTE|nr:type II toxin-antitoxin system PemK/MazF family toxin [Candidatus Tectomicrobia bacterium]